MLRDFEHVEEDDRYVRSRVEDRSPLIKLNYLYEKWRPIVWPLMLLAIAAGFDFKTPAQALKDTKKDLQAQIDVIKLRQDASYNDRVDQRKMLEFAVRYICASLDEKAKLQLAGTEACEAAREPMTHAAQARIRAPGEPP